MPDKPTPAGNPVSGDSAPPGRIAESRRLANRVTRELKKTAPFLGDQLLRTISQRAFELGLAEEMDLRQWSALVGLVLKARQQANQEHRAARFESPDGAGAGHGPRGHTGGGLSAEALAQIREAAGLL